MIKKTIEFLDLDQIADSGQCFRWQKTDDHEYEINAFGQVLRIKQTGKNFDIDCSEKEWEDVWKDYFDLDTDYESIADLILDSDDVYLKKCLDTASGVRILKQDLWEMIITFMISQNNNIARIKKSVAMLCERSRAASGGFPGPLDVSEDVFDDRSMGFGYRAQYLKEMFVFTASNPQWLSELREMDYDSAMKELMSRKGIGKKVANCICLFGLHHIDAFPVDTHVKQILEKYYPNGFDYERYKGCAGIVQQYMFYHKLNKE